MPGAWPPGLALAAVANNKKTAFGPFFCGFFKGFGLLARAH
jgi:hypothetical protein